MTYLQLKDSLTIHLEADLDQPFADPGEAVNYAVRLVGRRMFLVRTATVTVAINEAKVALDGAVPRIVEAFYVTEAGGTHLKDALGHRGLMSLAEFEAEYPDWASGGTAAVPVAAMQLDKWLHVYPKVVAANQLKVTGHALPANLVADGDVPDIPVWCHESLVHAAAVYAANIHATEEEGFARLQRYDAQVAALIDEEGRRNRESWAGTSGRRQQEKSLR